MANVEAKKAVVSEIKKNLDNAKSVVLVDSRGLTVEKDTQLRKELREAGFKYKVYKNTMLRFAVKDSEFEPLADYFEGPTAVAISYDDATGAIRIIGKSAKESENISFKAGIIDGKLYDGDAVLAIASIPSREELLSKLLGSFKSPMASFARVIKAVADKKSV